MQRISILGIIVMASATASLACTGSMPASAVPTGTAAPPPSSAAPAPAAAAPLPQPAPAAPPSSVVTLDNETLRLESTPPVPAELSERMEQYLNTRSAGLQDLGDTGSQILISTRFAETAQLHLVTMPMGARTQLTFGNEPVGSASFVPGDPSALLYLADIGGNEQNQIFRMDRKTGRSIRLTDPKARNGAPVWSDDGRWIAYSSNARNGRDMDIWVSDGRDPASARKLADLEGYWVPADWSPDGKKLLVAKYVSINESHLHLMDVASGALTRISPESPTASYGNALFGKDNKTVYVVSDREGEFKEIYETDTTGSAWRSLTRSISWDVETMDLTPDGRTLAFTVNQGGYSVLYTADTRSRKVTAVPGIPKGIIGGLAVARKANVLGMSFASSTQVGDVYTYDLGRKKLTRWTASEMGGLDAANLIEPVLIEFPSFDGRRIPAFYYRPAGKGPFPVVINIHGGPESQSRPVFVPLTQYLAAESKVATIYPNVRGSSGYGKTYLTLDNAMLREDSVKDIGALLDWIATQPELDAKRVAVLGGSYGGYMVLASLVHFGKRLVAGVDVVGISNFNTFLQNTADYRRDLRRVEYGDERDPEMKKFLEAISPLTHVAKIQSALFVAQGANDPRVPASEAEQIVRAVRAAGLDVWYMLAKNEGHGFAKKENRDLYTLLTVMFLEKHLLGR